MQELTPPDESQCQALVPGEGPFTTGGKIGNPRNGYRIRCENKPTVIAIENKPGPDGLIGSMSLCDDCQKEFLRQLGEDFAHFETIN